MSEEFDATLDKETLSGISLIRMNGDYVVTDVRER